MTRSDQTSSPRPGPPGSAWTLVIVIAGSLLAGPSALAVGEPSPGVSTAEACQAPDLSLPPLGDDQPFAVEPQAVAVDAGWQDGRWRRLSRAPFGTSYGPAVWTGRRLVIMEPDDGRTATYDPARDRWREVATAPRPTETFTPSLWTGSELVITEVASDGSSIGGLAYDPAMDRWRELARLPFTPTRRDHQLADAIWTGTHIIVVESDGLVAAHDVEADCWTELGEVPGDSVAWNIYRDGATLLIESRDFDTGTSMQRFDPVTGEWSEPAIAPFEVAGRSSDGSWVGDALVYLTWAETDDYAGASAAFDPATMTWSSYEHDCTTSASRTIEAGGLLVASNGRRALDPTTLTCVALPKPPRALNGTESFAWTGNDLIAWGGIRSLPEPPRRGGVIFRPGAPPRERP